MTFKRRLFIACEIDSLPNKPAPFYLDHITLFGLLRWRLASLTDHSLIKSYGCYYIFKSIVN